MRLGQVARLLAPPSKGPRLRQAKVTAIHATDGTVSLLLGGATIPVAGIRYAAGCYPRIGSAVWVLGQPPDMWAVASLSNVPVPFCVVRRQTNQGSTSGDPETVTFTMAMWDPWNMWDPDDNPGRVVVPLPGVYTAYGLLAWANNGNGRREATIRLNSTNRATNMGNPPSTGGAFLTVACPPVRCDRGDYFNLVGLQGSGGSLALISGTVERLVLGVVYHGPP